MRRRKKLLVSIPILLTTLISSACTKVDVLKQANFEEMAFSPPIQWQQIEEIRYALMCMVLLFIVIVVFGLATWAVSAKLKAHRAMVMFFAIVLLIGFASIFSAVSVVGKKAWPDPYTGSGVATVMKWDTKIEGDKTPWTKDAAIEMIMNDVSFHRTFQEGFIFPALLLSLVIVLLKKRFEPVLMVLGIIIIFTLKPIFDWQQIQNLGNSIPGNAVEATLGQYNNQFMFGIMLRSLFFYLVAPGVAVAFSIRTVLDDGDEDENNGLVIFFAGLATFAMNLINAFRDADKFERATREGGGKVSTNDPNRDMRPSKGRRTRSDLVPGDLNKSLPADNSSRGRGEDKGQKTSSSTSSKKRGLSDHAEKQSNAAGSSVSRDPNADMRRANGVAVGDKGTSGRNRGSIEQPDRTRGKGRLNKKGGSESESEYDPDRDMRGPSGARSATAAAIGGQDVREVDSDSSKSGLQKGQSDAGVPGYSGVRRTSRDHETSGSRRRQSTQPENESDKAMKPYKGSQAGTDAFIEPTSGRHVYGIEDTQPVRLSSLTTVGDPDRAMLPYKGSSASTDIPTEPVATLTVSTNAPDSGERDDMAGKAAEGVLDENFRENTPPEEGA